uniref:Auxilin-like protein 1 n=1 Tax=Ascaris lumbricoides TaxID=6252 RepID=A0A0M3IK74_ASCLU
MDTSSMRMEAFEAFIDMALSRRTRPTPSKSALPKVTRDSLPYCSGLMVSIPELMQDLVAKGRYQCSKNFADKMEGDQRVPEVLHYDEQFLTRKQPSERVPCDGYCNASSSCNDLTAASCWYSSDTSSSHGYSHDLLPAFSYSSSHEFSSGDQFDHRGSHPDGGGFDEIQRTTAKRSALSHIFDSSQVDSSQRNAIFPERRDAFQDFKFKRVRYSSLHE